MDHRNSKDDYQSTINFHWVHIVSIITNISIIIVGVIVVVDAIVVVLVVITILLLYCYHKSILAYKWRVFLVSCAACFELPV